MAAYKGEDHLAEVLSAMKGLPFWLSEMEVGKVPRASPELIARVLGPKAVTWVRRLGRGAPGWANVRFLREVERQSEVLTRREHLLGWVIATLTGQHGYALKIAVCGSERFGGDLFRELERSSTRSLRWGLLLGLPGFLVRRLSRF